MARKEYTLYIDSFLSVIMPVVLEKGVPGYYAEVSDFDADQVLSESQVNAVLTYSVYYCAQNCLLNEGYEYQEIINTLDSSIDNIDCLKNDEKELTRKFIIAFRNCKIIRQDHAFDDWLCEVVWPFFRDDEYVYPSPIARLISYGLDQKYIFEISDIRMTDKPKSREDNE